MSDEQDKAYQIFRGLLRHYNMPPMQALVMIGLYNQFPLRYKMADGFYFRPDEPQLVKSMRIKLPVYYHLLRGLLRDGFIERKKSKPWGYEYRIVFDKLAPLVQESVTDGEATNHQHQD